VADTERASAKGPDSTRIKRRREHAQRAPTTAYLERRGRLLEAATVVFKDKGLEQSSINDIAVAVGADRASIYYYFKSKQEIFLAVVRRAVEPIVLNAESIASSSRPAPDRLQQIVSTLLEAYEQHYPYMHLYIQEDMRRVPGDGTDAGEELKALGLRYEAAIGAVTRDGVQSGEFRRGLDPQLVMFAVLGAMNWTHRWFVPGGRLTGSEIGEGFAALFLDGVREP